MTDTDDTNADSGDQDPLHLPVVNIPSGTCDLCDRDAVTDKTIRNKANGLTAVANLCEVHLDMLERYNRGEDR